MQKGKLIKTPLNNYIYATYRRNIIFLGFNFSSQNTLRCKTNTFYRSAAQDLKYCQKR